MKLGLSRVYDLCVRFC
uniref:Uncharacterized protein n=1 Tax=Anguilla anguilla TaxID=7936 RepID=A0A0E9U6W0_ANGAN